MGKYCEGPEEHDPHGDGNMDKKSPIAEEKTHAPDPGDKQNALLQAIQALLSQVEALQPEQQTLCDTVMKLKTAKDQNGGGVSTHESSARADNNNNNSSIQKEQQPPSGPHSGSGQPISGTVLKAVTAGTYVDFLDVLPRLKLKPDTCGDVISGTGDRKGSMTQKVTIELFDSWLEAWSIYEALVMDVTPLC